MLNLAEAVSVAYRYDCVADTGSTQTFDEFVRTLVNTVVHIDFLCPEYAPYFHGDRVDSYPTGVEHHVVIDGTVTAVKHAQDGSVDYLTVVDEFNVEHVVEYDTIPRMLVAAN